MIKTDYEQAALFLLERDNYLVVSHACADGDTIGSASALVMLLRKKGKNAYAFCPDGVPERLKPFCGEDIFVKEILPHDTRISVDVATPAMLGNMAEQLMPFDLSVDHHKINTIACERLLLKDNFISNSEIIVALYDQFSVEIDKSAAECLYAGITSDSGGFRYSNTRPETMRIAARLMETGIDFAKINRIIFDQMTPPVVALLKEAYNNI